MAALHKTGKIRAIGVSNFSAEQMRQAARELGVTIIAYSPLAQGIL
jgi:diketogulonate reductase-like aldo/keto reductase